MLPEITRIEPNLKQILYGCVEHVQATKAALYLSVTHNLNERRFSVVTGYQFNDPLRRDVAGQDAIVDRLMVRRDAFFVNGVATERDFSELLFRQGSDRLLVVPLLHRGRLIGFIDMRDKAGRQPFAPADLDAARKIGEEMLGVLSSHQLFGIEPPSPATSAISNAPVAAPPLKLFSDEATNAIDSARAQMGRRNLAREAQQKRALAPAELEGAHLLVTAGLAVPGAVAVALSGIESGSNHRTIASAGELTTAAQSMLGEHITAWLSARKIEAPPTVVALRPIPAGSPVTPAPMVSILSAPVKSATAQSFILTVAFEKQPDKEALRYLQIFLKQIEQSFDSAIAAGTRKVERMLIAEKLVEPDFEKFPALRQHSAEIADLAEHFAISIGLPPPRVEVVRLAAFVHDTGLRFIDYARVYRKAGLSAEELRTMQEHPTVGAAVIDPFLGHEIAFIVLCHHERIDGHGYPGRLKGEAIPLESRIIAICDAWHEMTSTTSYQSPISREAAQSQMRAGAGTQFDAALVEQFLKLPQ